jgi:hypothetical protein
MKISSSTEKNFNPITFNITVESIEELAILSSCFNFSIATIKQNTPLWANFVMSTLGTKNIDKIQMELYEIIEKYSERFNLK